MLKAMYRKNVMSTLSEFVVEYELTRALPLVAVHFD